ncbi:sigma factor-like helix-turn-helix DNA-binding protein [Paenibacillus sp. 1P03SA]|uniref:helix-turn-helix domain-containing protein n=1 Tax=Paenibacillus sp. 1P03SA TaxID=3132294 RepID=UPI0039A1171B
MGAVKVDLSKGGKRLESLYPLSSEEGVRKLLEQVHHVRSERITRGDYDAVVMLVDFEQSIKDACLTERQQQVIYYAYERDLPQSEIAGMLGMSQQGVSNHLNAAIRKIAAINEKREEGTATWGN